jgi:ribonuclease HI
MVRECKKAFADISTQYIVGLDWVTLDDGVPRNEIADKLANDCSVQKFVQPEPPLVPLGKT